MQVGKKSTRRWQPWPARSLSRKKAGGVSLLRTATRALCRPRSAFRLFAPSWKRRDRVRSQKSEVRCQKSEVGSRKSEIRNQKSENRGHVSPLGLFLSLMKVRHDPL